MALSDTERVQRFRRHNEGDHSQCDPAGKCEVARDLYFRCESRIQAIALFAEFERAGINPLDYLGDELYEQLEADASAELPEYEYLRTDPNTVDYLAARSAIKLGCYGTETERRN